MGKEKVNDVRHLIVKNGKAVVSTKKEYEEYEKYYAANPQGEDLAVNTQTEEVEQPVAAEVKEGKQSFVDKVAAMVGQGYKRSKLVRGLFNASAILAGVGVLGLVGGSDLEDAIRYSTQPADEKEYRLEEAKDSQKSAGKAIGWGAALALVGVAASAGVKRREEEKEELEKK
ncbi:MAG: hypothetical protein LBM01_03355 [Christensenellaceae bacterium]|jgi:hypothetical protein|nr:hypothetical protein [Christensenellaceae bacterium]